MDEVRLSDWPEPPGSTAWLPAYGFQHEVIEKDDFFSTNGDTGSTHALYLETIVEETSDDLRSERSSVATWLSDSDADSVIHVRGAAGSECDSESEREWACPAKRRRRERPTSPGSPDSLSRSSSLAQFESLERSCAAPASPSLSPDSLESPPGTPPPAPATRVTLSAENLSEDSGYSERARRPPSQRPTEIARRRDSAAAGSAPCLLSTERRLRRAARALSLPADLDVCAEPTRADPPHRAAFRQTFRVADSLTVSVADLTALDYRGGPRRPRHPPPPPPRPPPPTPPAREPSAGSDSTTESELAFAREMETTARRLDETAKRALAEAGDYEREISVLTTRRLHESTWGAWDDVLVELRRRVPPPSPTPSPPASPPASPPHYPSRSPSPDAHRDGAFSSTPLRPGSARVRSTPELRSRATPHRETPEELRASLRHVDVDIVPGAAPPARSASAGSKGVTFSPVVAEVSWRESSASGTERSTSTSDDGADAEVAVIETVEAAEGGETEAARAHRSQRGRDMTETGARGPRGRIAGFLSRFANFRFSGRKGEKKSRSAGASARPPPAVPAVPTVASQGPRAAAGAPHSVRIPLKEPVEARVAGGVGGVVSHKPPRPPVSVACGVLETDVDAGRTVLHARSLLALAPPDQRTHRPHKSMEFLLDKDSAQTIQPPENELQKNSDRVLSEHELRVQRSLQKLNVPEWYKNAPTPREGFLLRKRLSDASSAPRWSGLNSKTTSLGSLGGASPQPPPQLSPHTTSFGRWSTSRLNSNQTSPCSSARSSVRGGSPLCSPSTRSSFSARQPYLGWRSQERLNSTPRTPHERLASSLLQQSASSKASEEIQSSIKEVTSAIVHYVSGLQPDADLDQEPSPRSSQKLYWVESSFVGTKPTESPQTPHLTEALPPRPPSSLRLEHRATPDWQDSPRQMQNLGLTRPSPGSTTLEDVLDSLLGLPSQPARIPTPQPSPRKTNSPYYFPSGKSPRYEPLSGTSSESPLTSHSRRPSASPGDTMRRLSDRAQPSPDAHAGKDTVDKWHNAGVSCGRRVRRRSEPSVCAAPATLSRRPSLDAASTARAATRASLASLASDNSTEDNYVKCKYPKCGSRTTLGDAKRHYKTCHNCAALYCSKECRRSHWEKHRKVCLHSRASALCRQIISTAKEDADSLLRISNVAHEGYLERGRGVVRVSFASPEAAERFASTGHRHLGDPEYVNWTALQPTEMGAELYTEVVKLCKSYNPENRVILFVAVCVVSEVPTKGAVKWERQTVSRCAKLRLSRTVTAAIQERGRRRARPHVDTLVLSGSGAGGARHRETWFANVQRELEMRGVTLRRHHPEVYERLAEYAAGRADTFSPVTIYPQTAGGRTLACVITAEAWAGSVTRADGRVTVVDVGRDRHTLSTPM